MRRPFSAALLIAAFFVSACNSNDSVLDASSPTPAAAVGDMPALAPAELAAGDVPVSSAQPVGLTSSASLAPTTLDAQAAALSQGARIQLAPIVGATVEAITPLSRRLSQRAAQRGIGLTATGDAAATHMMKGYFSAFTDDGETTVIYVWDVLDPAGNRLHRIQGQEQVAGARREGWSGVPSQTMEAVADKTVDQLTAWLAVQPG